MDQVGLNPFEENDVDEDHDSLPALYVNSEDLACNIKSSINIDNECTVSIDNMAARLINDRFILTALEFHMELMEMGLELPRFRDFFSNPANFERGRIVDTSYSHNKLTRTSSIQTFDSLDFARYSDDGERHENDRIAVLEFELRKAHEKINSLRSLLTKTAETDFVVTSLEPAAQNSIKTDETLPSYEKRALNFLVNEYLLKHGYKLTSVTFSEENDSQDFDDWDDVGINISKPPSLMKLFRDYGQHVSPSVQKQDFECMTSLDTEDICEKVFEARSELDSFEEKLALLEKSLESKVKENNELKMHLEDLKVSLSNNLNNGVVSKDSQHLTKDANDITIAELHHCSEDKLINSRQSSVTDSTESKIFENLTQTNPSKEVVFTSFQEELFNIISKNNRIFEKSSEANPLLNSLASVVNILGDTLPRVVPNILLAKRDELIPLLISAATLHPNVSKRDELLSLIFNLIKRPNAEQRQAIMKGCVAFAHYVGPLQTEAELLPQCWEQISHKYPERRLLVAETCGFLSPYVFDAIRSSLLLSMLVQMSEDREEDVREAVAMSLGVLVSFLEQNDKYNQTLNLLSRFLLDPSEKVVSATKTILLPSVARWSMQLKCLETFLNHAVIEPIESSIYLTSPNSSYSHYAVKDHKLFISNMSTLESLLPYIFSHVISSCYDYRIKENNNQPYASETDCSFFNSTDIGPLSDISIILSKEKSEIFVKNFFSTVSQEWFAMWNEYNWLSSDLIHRLVELSNKLEVSQPSLHSLVTFFRKTCLLFGKHLMLSLVKPKFEKLMTIPRDENSLDRAVMSGLSNLNRSIVPVFVAGVYPAMLNNVDLSNKFSENYEALYELLCELLSSLAVHQSPLISLQAAFTELCSQGSTEKFNPHELLLHVLWNFGIIHKNPLVRVATSQMFECLVLTCKLSETTISNKVIPALVTLSSDTDESVRVSTISPFGAILEYLSTHFDVNDLSIANTIDKVQLQLQVFMEDHQTPEARSKDKSNVSSGTQLSSNAGNASILEIVKVLGRLGPKVDSKFRDEFVLPRLTALAVRNQLSLNANSSFKQEVTMRLLDAFINVSCCFLNCQISQEVVLPGLRCLHHDIQTLAPDRANIVASMMKEMEDKIENKSSHAARTPHVLSVIKSEECTNTPQPLHTEMMKLNLLGRIKDVKDRATHGQFTKMFQISKR